MKFRTLGNSDLHVSEIALGSWRTYGTSVNRKHTQLCLDAAFASGINLIDTANSYGRGKTEKLLGDSLTRYSRDQYVLATKVYYPMSSEDRGLSRDQIHKQLNASLKRLRTDHIDLYQCHRFDRDTPLDETMHALHEVVRAGKVRFIGFSEWSATQAADALEYSNGTSFVSSQPRYSMLYRKPERKIFPYGKATGLGQIVWSPLAQGVLTGKYKPGVPPPASSRGARKKIGFSTAEVLAAVQLLKPIAQDLGISLSQLALAWVLANNNVTSAITGASSADQIVHNTRATDVSLDQPIMRAIDRTLSDVIKW